MKIARQILRGFKRVKSAQFFGGYTRREMTRYKETIRKLNKQKATKP